MTKTAFIPQHNQRQRRYFEAAQKPTMRPADTPYIRRQADEVLRFGNLTRGNRILEVGCGMGRYTFYLARRGFRVEGLELSPVQVEWFKAFDGGSYGVPVHCGDILDYGTRFAGQFDAVIGFFVLHHLHDLSACFSSIARILKPGGRMVFLEPNPFNPLYYLQIFLTPGMTWEGDGGIVQMQRNRVFAAMRDAGLSHCVMKRFGFFPPFLANLLWGSRAEILMEEVSIWRSLLPFQIFRADR